MQTVSQAVEDLIYVTGTERSRATQIARALIDAGILPKSAGRDIKKITGEQLLALLAAVAMAEKVVDAPRIATEFMSLPLRAGDDSDVQELTDSSSNLPQIFARIMEKREAWTRAEIEFAKQSSGYTATIRADLRNEKLSCKVELPFWQEKSWGHWCKTSFTISSEGVEILRNLFARDYAEERGRSRTVEVKVVKRRLNTAPNGPRPGTAEREGQDAS